ncbi:unnamed protein product [Urochloa humidicola]
MGSKGISISSVLICALMLALILEQVQVEAKKGKSCCPSTLKRNCYNACRLKFSQTTCASTCGCKIVPGITSRPQCPEGYRHLTFILDSEEPDSVEFCNLGCRSFVCNNINNVDAVDGMETIMERCGEGCDRFCNGDANVASVAA